MFKYFVEQLFYHYHAIFIAVVAAEPIHKPSYHAQLWISYRVVHDREFYIFPVIGIRMYLAILASTAPSESALNYGATYHAKRGYINAFFDGVIQVAPRPLNMRKYE